VITASIVRGVCAGVMIELRATLEGDDDVLTERVAAAMNAAAEAARKVFFSPTVPDVGPAASEAPAP
jgi:hypothetical protein